MVIEYWLQKKTIGGWSTITWHTEDELQKANRNYNAVRQNKGYSYRMVKVEVVEEHLLEEVTEIQAPSFPEPVSTNKWGAEPKSASNGWADAGLTNNGNVWGVGVTERKSNWSDNAVEAWKNVKPSLDIPSDSSKPEHGLTGSVWMINHGEKLKGRFPSDKVDAMIAVGWERGGPKTKFRE